MGRVFADMHFLRLKENWAERQGEIQRTFFTFHFGPYEQQWNLEKVKATKVVVRIDDKDYGGGLGIHIHDRAKENRIYQSQLKSPQLRDKSPVDFIEGVLLLRQGNDVKTAFRLEFN